MKEIEMKAWLKTSQQIESVRKFLRKNGKFLKKVTKKDIYFAKSKAKTFDFRLRDMEGRYFITQKKRLVIDGMEENEELEFEISDKAEFQALTKKLGYVIFLEKTKISEMYGIKSKVKNQKLKDQILLAEIVEVPGLGNFLEIERVCESEEEVSRAREMIRNIFRELFLEGNVEKREYAVLLRSR